MVTVSGAVAVTVLLPDGVVPLPVMVSVRVPGAAVVRPLEPPHDVTVRVPRPSENKAHRVQSAVVFATLFRANTRNNPVNAPGMSRPAKRRLDLSACAAATTVFAAVLMVTVPWAGFSLPFAFWLPGKVKVAGLKTQETFAGSDPQLKVTVPW